MRVDLIPFATDILSAATGPPGPEFFTDKVRISIWDSTELESGKVIYAIAHLKFVLKGQQPFDLYSRESEVLKILFMGGGCEE